MKPLRPKSKILDTSPYTGEARASRSKQHDKSQFEKGCVLHQTLSFSSGNFKLQFSGQADRVFPPVCCIRYMRFVLHLIFAFNKAVKTCSIGPHTAPCGVRWLSRKRIISTQTPGFCTVPGADIFRAASLFPARQPLYFLSRILTFVPAGRRNPPGYLF